MTTEKDFYDIVGIEKTKQEIIVPTISSVEIREQLDAQKMADERIEKDFDESFLKAQENLTYIVNSIKNHVLDLGTIAAEKESAKEYDAITNMLRTLNDVSVNMIVLQEKRKKFKEKKLPVNNLKAVENNTNNNIVFTGSTRDLKKFIKEINPKED